MRIGYIIDTLTSVDTHEIVIIGRKVIGFYEADNYRGNFSISPFRKYIEKLFALRQKNKDEGNNLMQGLVELIMNNFYGVQIRRDIDEVFKCKNEHWMQTEFNEIVLDYRRMQNGNYIVKLKNTMV